MAISGKPQKTAPATEPAKTPNEQDVFSLINKGGSVAKASAPKIDASDIKPMLVQLRLYPDLVEEIDAVRKAASGRGKKHRPPSRHAWIVSAIEEKLARDKAST
jgi:hypothetical protein